MEEGRNGEGSLVWPTLLDVPQRPSLDTGLQELLLFPGGLQGFLPHWEALRAGMWSKQWARQSQVTPPAQRLAQTHTHTPHILLCTTVLLPAHDPTLWGYPRPEQEAGELQPVLLFNPTWHIDIWEPQDLGGFWACPGGCIFPQTQPHSDSTWCSLLTRF